MAKSRLNRFSTTLAATLALVLFASYAYAQYTQTNNTPANGTSFGTGVVKTDGTVQNGGFFYRPPSGPPPVNPPATVVTNVEVCCNSAAYDPRCVEFSGTWNVKDGANVASSTQTIALQNSCSPCEPCKTIQLSADVNGPNNVFSHQLVVLPPKGITVTISARCRTCNSSAHGSSSDGTQTAGTEVPWPPTE